MLNKIYSLFFLFILSSVILSAQTATIRGFINDGVSGEPVIFTNIWLDGTTYGNMTDVNGFYTISQIPAGSYTLITTSLGYDTVRVEVALTAGMIMSQNITLNPATEQLADVVINVEQEEKKVEVKTSQITISPKQISKIPSIGGQPEIAQYLQVLPGVIFTGDQGGQLYIRGGSPVQNKVLIDGLTIYNPFHSIGLFSVFDSDLIRNADVYTGGFSAEYGGRISSIMDIRMKSGNSKKAGGMISVSPFQTKVMLEAPVKKSNNEDLSSSAIVVSAKTSYLDRTSNSIYAYANEEGLPFSFTDLYGKYTATSSTGSQFNLFGFNFNDKVVDYLAINNLNWTSSGGGTNFILIPQNSPVLVEGKFGYSNFKINMIEKNGNTRTSSVSGFNGGLDFTYSLGSDQIKYGFEFLGFSTDFSYVNTLGLDVGQKVSTSEIAGYFKYRKKIGLLIIDPSFRIHYYASLSNLSPEPRLGMKYNINENVRWKFSGGLFSQNLISATSERDVVNLFNGYLSGDENIPSTFNGKDLNGNKLQKASHIVTGFEFDLTNSISMNIEGYYKKFNQLTALNRNKLYEDNGSNWQIPDELKSDFVVEQGDAYGVDFNLKYDKKKVYLWAVYSLGKVTRFDGTNTYSTHFDRRHNVNLVSSYRFNKKWEINGRWNFGSAFPFTPTQGNFELLDLSGGLLTDYTTSNGNHEFILGDINSKRLTTYHRLDLTIKYMIEKKNIKADFNLGVTNAYNRNNIFYIDRYTAEQVHQLPIMPNFGMNLKF